MTAIRVSGAKNGGQRLKRNQRPSRSSLLRVTCARLSYHHRSEVIHVGPRRPRDEQISDGLKGSEGIIVEQGTDGIYALPTHPQHAGAVCERTRVVLRTVYAVRIGRQCTNTIEPVDTNGKRQEELGVPTPTAGAPERNRCLAAG